MQPVLKSATRDRYDNLYSEAKSYSLHLSLSMDKKKITTTAASGSASSTTSKQKKSSLSSSSSSASEPTAAATAISRNAALPRHVRRVLQNFLLVWLDANFDETNDDFKNSIQQLRHIVASITTFTDAQECIDFLNEIKNEKVFMIVSGALGKQLVPKIQVLPQLDSVYVFCKNKSYHKQWADTIPKVKGVHTSIAQICKALQIDRERCDRDSIPISFRSIDPSFMYSQLLKEIFLEIEDDDRKSIKELAEYCRLQDDIAEDEIQKVELEYRRYSPIWWYTAPYFVYTMLNKGLRALDVDILLKMSFFIRHLHKHRICSETMHVYSCRLTHSGCNILNREAIIQSFF